MRVAIVLLVRVVVAGIVFYPLVFSLYIWSLKVEEVPSGFPSEMAAISSEKLASTMVLRDTPLRSLVGLKLVPTTVGVLLMIQVRLSGEASTLPAWSLALTLKL